MAKFTHTGSDQDNDILCLFNPWFIHTTAIQKVLFLCENKLPVEVTATEFDVKNKKDRGTQSVLDKGGEKSHLWHNL